MTWKLIETAPHDGSRLLLWDASRKMAISGTWHNDPGRNDPDGYEPAWSWWVCDDDLIMWDGGDTPTHWMPLPLPPEGLTE